MVQDIVIAFVKISYKYIFKRILFIFPPDWVHLHAIKIGSFINRSRILTISISKIFRYQNQSVLAQVVDGNYYENPVGLSAGFDKNFELINVTPALGFGFEEGGSMTYEPSTGNPKPHYHRLIHTKSILVNAGLNNYGCKTLAQQIDKQRNTDSFYAPLNISVAKTNNKTTADFNTGLDDYINCLKYIDHENIGDLITINISCPNAYGGEPFTTPDRLEPLLKSISVLKMNKPIYIKMPSNLSWHKFNALLKIIVKYPIAGVTICNLAKTRTLVNPKDKLNDSIRGNLSGRPTQELSNYLIKKTYQNYGNKLTIIGVGGIFSAEDAYTKIKLGASLVELITGMIFEGPTLIFEINKGLVKLLQDDGYSSISQVIGIDSPISSLQ